MTLPTNPLTFDNRKRRATDLRQCTRVTLPKPLNPEEESRLEVRKRTQKDTFEKYRKENTNTKGEQKTNLSPEERSGLHSLQKKIKEEEIIIMKTDKSGRFLVITPEQYLEMGKVHTSTDKEITWEQVREMERKESLHTVA